MSSKSKKILIVDDDRNFNLMLSIRLQKKEFEVLQAYSGKEGISQSKKQAPDLVITDIRLPDTNGFEVVHELTASKIKTRIIILSGFDLTPDQIQKAHADGACDCIIKSEKIGEILEKSWYLW